MWFNKKELHSLRSKLDVQHAQIEAQRQQLDAQRSQIEALIEEVRRGNRRAVKSGDLIKSLKETIDPFFRYQNQKLDAMSAFFASDDKIFRFSMDGVPIVFYLPMAGADRVQSEILRTSYFYQPKPLFFIRKENLLPEGGTVIDAGANIGNHTVFFGKLMRASQVHSFEPNPPAHAILEKNVEINEMQDIARLHAAGLGQKATKARNLNGRSNNLGGNNVIDDEDGDVIVQRLDDLGLSKVDFIKIDVEGRGDGVIRGGIDLIARDKPVMLVEESSDGEKQTIEMLKSDFGYKEVWRKQMDLVLVP